MKKVIIPIAVICVVFIIIGIAFYDKMPLLGKDLSESVVYVYNSAGEVQATMSDAERDAFVAYIEGADISSDPTYDDNITVGNPRYKITTPDGKSYEIALTQYTDEDDLTVTYSFFVVDGTMYEVDADDYTRIEYYWMLYRYAYLLENDYVTDDQYDELVGDLKYELDSLS